jgi:hypothetical protein
VINSGEEHYAFFRLVEFGFKIAYAPQAIVFHPKSLMTREALLNRMAEAVAYTAFVAFNRPSIMSGMAMQDDPMVFRRRALDVCPGFCETPRPGWIDESGHR